MMAARTWGNPPKTGFRERNLIRGKTRQGKGYHKLRMKQSSCISNDWKPENSVRRQAIFFAASHGRRPLLLPRRIPRLQHLRPCNSSISAELLKEMKPAYFLHWRNAIS